MKLLAGEFLIGACGGVCEDVAVVGDGGGGVREFVRNVPSLRRTWVCVLSETVRAAVLADSLTDGSFGSTSFDLAV